MRILTPTGYRYPDELKAGSEVCAFDGSGRPIVNRLEKEPEWVNESEWKRWWDNVKGGVRDFRFATINGKYRLNSEQSVWRNGTRVCHARHLKPGDIIHDANNDPILIERIEWGLDDGWYRFEVDGDHSYIVDGMAVHNASRFWVGGSGTWDASDTTHWAATSNGAGGQSVPGSSDTVTFDASSSSGAATCTVGAAYNPSIQSLTFGTADEGFIIDFATNDNNITLSASGSLSGTGTSTRQLDMGDGTWTCSSTTVTWEFSTVTNLTLNANSSTILFSNTTTASSRTFNGGGKTWNNFTVAATSGGGLVNLSGANTFNTVTATRCAIAFPGGVTTTVTALALNGSAYNSAVSVASTSSTAAVISDTAGTDAMTWCVIKNMTFQGGATFTATNSIDLLNNTGVTITGPSGASGVIGE